MGCCLHIFRVQSDKKMHIAESIISLDDNSALDKCFQSSDMKRSKFVQEKVVQKLLEPIVRQQTQHQQSKRQLEREQEKPSFRLNTVEQKQVQSIQYNLKRSQQESTFSMSSMNMQQMQKRQNQILILENLFQQATKAHGLNLFTKQKQIYRQCLIKLQALAHKTSKLSIEEVKASIYSSLVNIAMTQKDQNQADIQMELALKAYKRTLPSSTAQEKITLLNNYSLFKRSCGKVQEAIKYLQKAIGLIEKYCLIQDDRKYLALINLGCLCCQSSNRSNEGDRILQRIARQCKNLQVVSLAKCNQLQC